MQSLLHHLRQATAPSHDSLDAAFGSLDLKTRDGYARFLSGHAIGLAPLFDSFHSFVTRDLSMNCPDYRAMLHADLAALGIDADSLPELAKDTALSPRSSGYVIAGSRLGLTTLRRNGYWGQSQALPSSYMEDDSGLAIWKETAIRFKAIEPDADEAARESAGAVAAFDTFRAAFVASAPEAVR